MFYTIYTLRLEHILATDVKSIKMNSIFSLFYEECIIVLHACMFNSFLCLSTSDFILFLATKLRKYRVSCSCLPKDDI
jgi:hypothetical protein